MAKILCFMTAKRKKMHENNTSMEERQDFFERTMKAHYANKQRMVEERRGQNKRLKRELGLEK